MMIRLWFVLFFALYLNNLFGQFYNYQHYDIENGLSGLTVYKIIQDKQGFIWFATETGLSRFDGSTFKNFSTSDGLPDNEILDLYLDSKGRLWILPFSNTICYYLKGKIYTQKNDTLLSKIKLKAEPVSITENVNGSFAIIENLGFTYVSSSGNVKRYDSIYGSSLSTFGTTLRSKKDIVLPLAFGRLRDTVALIKVLEDSVATIKSLGPEDYSLSNKSNFILTDKLSISRKKDSLNIVLNKTAFHNIKIPEHFISLSLLSDSLLALNCSDKVLTLDLYKNTFCDTFLINKVVNYSFKDSEGNYWFATNGYGVYRLGSTAIINYNLTSGDNLLPVYSIEKEKNKLYIGTNRGIIWNINLNSKSTQVYNRINETGETRITGITLDEDKAIVNSGSAMAITCIDINNQSVLLNGTSAKSAYREENELLVSTIIGVYVVNIANCSIEKILFHNNRSTCAIKFKGDYYIGSLQGLYYVAAQGNDSGYLGANEALLFSRISALSKTKESLWVATYGNGIIEIKNNRIVNHYTQKDGLTSNMCRDIAVDGDALWVGTDKGLNKIKISKKSKILNYTTKDGLNTNLINCLLVKNDSVFIGTPYGLTFFNTRDINTSSIANIYIDSIASKRHGWHGSDTGFFKLKAGDNKFYIEYGCISFKSNGNINYYYRIKGLDNEWHVTKERFVDYASLPHGDYVFELYAINAFGKKSSQININFSIDSFFYQKTWFLVLVVLLVGGIIWFFVSLRIRKIRRQENEKLKTQARLTELEQMAFRAQMNPHFIFNCLNSIQQYIFSKTALEANRFITEFSSLIRQTLDISSKKYILLEEEIKYISTYLSLEHTRFDKSFDYDISISENIVQEEISLPPLLLQPFVENAIRHGIRNLKTTRGKIDIKFYTKNQYFIYELTDNGIGIEASLKLRGMNVIEHQSKGMTLIKRRIETLNEDSEKKIMLEIDYVDDILKTGTRVVIKLPL